MDYLAKHKDKDKAIEGLET